MPDLTILVDVRPEVGLNRISSNNREQNRLDLEKLSFHEKVYEGYKIVEERFKDRVKTVNGEQAKEDVLKDTINVINEFLKERK